MARSPGCGVIPLGRQQALRLAWRLEALARRHSVPTCPIVRSCRLDVRFTSLADRFLVRSCSPAVVILPVPRVVLAAGDP